MKYFRKIVSSVSFVVIIVSIVVLFVLVLRKKEPGSLTSGEIKQHIDSVISKDGLVDITPVEGPRGEQGITGEKGDQGLQGEMGETGAQGEKGDSFITPADPDVDRIVFWDDSTGAATWLELGSNLAITDTTLNATDQYTGTVTSIGSGNGLTGGPVTVSGTLSMTLHGLRYAPSVVSSSAYTA